MAGFVAVGAVATYEAAIALFDQMLPDVLLVDTGLPDLSRIEVVRRAAAKRRDCDILVVTVFGDDAHIVASIEAGATGYLLKDDVARGLIEYIRMLRDGGSPISPSIARRQLSHLRRPTAQAGPEKAALGSGNALSECALGFLRLVAKGTSVQEIGAVLEISTHAVVAHVKNIYCNLAVHSRGEAVFEVKQMGLL